MLSVTQLAQVFSFVRQSFAIVPEAEITLETNPETYSAEKFSEYKKMGINRISLGIQSFNPRYLSALGRVHSKERAITALEGIRGIFANVSIDLMSALPEQTLDEARDDLLTATGFNPQHISCYELTYEKGTALYGQPKNELDAEMYMQTKEILTEQGYRQYEISNYALPGFESRHNLAYWSDKSYLGLGLAAHSYDADKKIRWSNTGDLEKYLSGDFFTETVPEDDFNKIMMGLRKNSGISLKYFDGRQKNKLKKLAQRNLLNLENDNARLTDSGQLVLNEILLELM